MSDIAQRKQQQTAEQRVAAFFKENATDDSISASQLADICERDAKTVRAHLRRIKSRDQSKYKNAQYRISQELATSVVEHFDNAKRMTAQQ